jgi:hypothetical protein
MVRPAPNAAFGSLPTGGPAVSGGTPILAGSGGFGADGAHEATSININAKEMVRGPNFR